MITLNPNLPYGEVLGISDDGARYRQGEYRFTADGKVIGDTIKLELAAKQSKMAALQLQMDAQRREIEAMGVEMEGLNSGAIPAVPAPVVQAPAAPTIGLQFQQSENPTQAVPNVTPVTPAFMPAAPVAPAAMIRPAAI
jgi:hypothetical protein